MIDKMSLPPDFPSGRLDYEASLDWSNLPEWVKVAIWARAEVDQASGVVWVPRRREDNNLYIGVTLCLGRKSMDKFGCYCGGDHEGEIVMVDCEGVVSLEGLTLTLGGLD